MFQVPATVMGMIGSAFMVASFAPGAVGQAPVTHTASATSAFAQTVDATVKTDRVNAPQVSSARQSVSVVELVGVSNVQVVLKDDRGNVLFHSNPQTNTTYFSKDTDLPLLTLKEEVSSDVKRQPVSRGAREDGMSPKKRANPYGCIGSVSPLAQAGKEAAASLCVTNLDALAPIHG